MELEDVANVLADLVAGALAANVLIRVPVLPERV
jgi:hypothetical protein